MISTGKGKKIDVQVDVKTEEQWEELLSKEGLIVVDAYAGWCGPCRAIESTLRRIRNETGDDLLHFAMAETDHIESLEAYRDKSQPTFLFFGGGQLVHVIRGCDAPSLNRSIAYFLNEEHRILKGDAERKVLIDTEAQLSVQTDEKSDEEKEASNDEIEIVEVQKEISVVIIKPDALESGHADDIIKNIEDCGIEILHKEEKVLSKEEAAEFYKQHEGSEYFEQLIEFMSSGPVLTLVISKRGDDPGYGLIPEVRNLIGPKDINLAKEEAPNSIRAQYGTDSIMNAVHSCDTSDSAAKELAFFFPDFNIPKVQEKRRKQRIQRTLALIRPGAYAHRKDSILRTIEEAGFNIAMSKEMYLSREQAEEFYEEHKGEHYFESLINNMTSGPSLALCLARDDAVAQWRDLIGPKDVSLAKEEAPESLRAVFADDNEEINPIHGADSIEAAEKELRTFFPPQATVAVIKPEAYSVPEQREEIVEQIKQAGFKISAQKEISLSKELASQFYEEHQGKEFFDGLTDYMSSGPTLFMILSREDAIAGFRALVGPTEPDVAKERAPNSLRALYATDLMKNAIHSSSNATKAAQVIQEYFPEVVLNLDGTVAEPTSKDEHQEVNQVQQQLQEEPSLENELEVDTQEKSAEHEGQNESEMANAPGDESEVTVGVKTEDENNEDQLAGSATDNPVDPSSVIDEESDKNIANNSDLETTNDKAKGSDTREEDDSNHEQENNEKVELEKEVTETETSEGLENQQQTEGEGNSDVNANADDEANREKENSPGTGKDLENAVTEPNTYIEEGTEAH